MPRFPQWSRRGWIGFALVWIGVVSIFAPFPGESPLDLAVEGEVSKAPELQTAFPVQAIRRYRLTAPGGATVHFDAALYRDAEGQNRRALLPVPQGEGDRDPARMRLSAWKQAVEAIGRHAPKDVPILCWWDNCQRLHLYTGRPVWSLLPSPAAWASAAERRVWRELAGGFSDDTRLKQLADWLTRPVARVLPELAATWRDRTPPLLLVTLDDLARLSEIERLAGRRLPIEAVEMPYTGDVHGGVARVRQWASEAPGTGSYLVQPLSGQRMRVWRITDAAAHDWLLLRLLPFNTSFERPIDALPLVYQAGAGGYLSVHQLKPERLEPANP